MNCSKRFNLHRSKKFLFSRLVPSRFIGHHLLLVIFVQVEYFLGQHPGHESLLADKPLVKHLNIRFYKDLALTKLTINIKIINFQNMT